MEIWLEMIRDNNLFKLAHPAGIDEIDNTEKQLGLVFADDYRTFLSEIGASICFGHEINGITDNINLNVIRATKEAWGQMALIPHSWYVIEDTHIDGIIILQDSNGSVYQMAPEMMPMKIAYSLESYISETVVGIKNRVAGNPSIPAKKESEFDNAAQEILNKNYEVAKEKLKDPNQVEKVLQQVEKKLEKVPGIGDWLADVPAVISLIRSYIRKEYKDVPVGSIIAGLAAILYLVSPIDIIPDFMPAVGLLDDAAVFVVCWKMIHDDVDKYQAWRKQMGKEIS